MLGRYLMGYRALLEPRLAGRWTRVACTGHRPQNLPSDSEPWLTTELRRIAAKLATDHGTNVAISGAAAGADLLWAHAAHHRNIPVWLYQPHHGHDARWPEPWRDRLTTARGFAARIDTLGTKFSMQVLHARNDWMIRDCDAIIAVIDPHHRHGGTWQTLQKIPASMPVIHVDVRHRRTTLRPTAATAATR